MDVEQEAKENPKDQIESESPESEAVRDATLKRKLDDETEPDESCSSKKLKVEVAEEAKVKEKEHSDSETKESKDDVLEEESGSDEAVPDQAETEKEEVPVPEKSVTNDADKADVKTEVQTDVKTEVKTEAEQHEEDVKTEEKQDGDEKEEMVVKEESEETEEKMEEGDSKEEVKVEKVKEEKLEEADEAKAQSKEELNADVANKEKEQEEESPTRRYPTRNRHSEDKATLDLTKSSSGSRAEEKADKDDKSKESSSSEDDKTPSVKSDGGSDKENMNGGTPMDLSQASTPDVITLSDEEENSEHRKRSREQSIRSRKKVRLLQSQLRNEEAKLVLLKKLRQSQLTPQIQDHPQMPNSSSSQPSSKPSVPRQPGGPPPLVRGGNQQGRGSNLHMQQQQQQQQGRSSSSSSSQGQMRNMQGPPPLVGTPRGATNSSNGHGAQSMRNSHALAQQQHRTAQQTVAHQQAATPPQPPVETQTPAQRQAAAKLALRKQLEKTLLQIPPPKPPAPEMNFIPSLACPDFVLLLGLEEVVNHIIDLQLIARGQKSPDEKFICNPFTCVQCGTDYTPVWKREKPGSKNVICEHCVTWNQKRALKQEHTNRLKSAFVKALQQEQEIERMQGQATPSGPTPSGSGHPTPSATPPMTQAPSQALAAAQAASNVAAAAAMTMSPASYRASAEQVRQHHNFLQQAHQAQLRAGQPLAGLQGFGARSPFPYNIPYVKQADLQRQYLLDMIPRAGMSWKP